MSSGLGDDVVKHLEMLQAVVTRLAQNSFAYKAWAVALVSAIIALAAKNGSCCFVLIGLLPALVFWGLDSYYLRQERLFCRLYDVVRGAYPDAPTPAPFSMDTEPYGGLEPKVASWCQVCWSPTEAWLYGPIVVVIVSCAVAFALTGQCQPVTH